MQFYQTRSHAIVLHNTLPAICIEKAVCMKTKEGLYHKVYLSPRFPRVVLKTISARTSCDHPSAPQSSRETLCNNVDNRIPSILHSAVEQQNTNRRDTVTKLIQQFESHPSKESFLQDLNKTEGIYEFSEKSQKLIADMNNTEIFELCETPSKKQCTDCASYWEIGIVHCTCGRCLKSSRGMYCKAKEMPQKAHQPKHGGEKSKLEKWHKDDTLCHSSGGPRSKLLNMTRLPWKTIHTSQQNLKEFKMQNIGYSDSMKTVLNNH